MMSNLLREALTTIHLLLSHREYKIVNINIKQKNQYITQSVIFISSVYNLKSLPTAFSLGKIAMMPSMTQSTSFMIFFFLNYLVSNRSTIPFLKDASISKQTSLFLLRE
jgi:uncharacterized protein YbgA (DUF1722 family)